MLHCAKCNKDYHDPSFKFCPSCACALQSKSQAPQATETSDLKPFASYKCKNCHQIYVYDPNFQGDNCFYHAGEYIEYGKQTQNYFYKLFLKVNGIQILTGHIGLVVTHILKMVCIF